MNTILRAAAAAAAACVLSACNLLFLDDSAVSRAKDKTPPAISIVSPSDGFQCANIVEVVGSVSDATNSNGAAGKVASLSYAVPGSALSGTAAVAADGTFSFQLSTATLGATFTLTLTAVDWNGNSAAASLNLLKASGNSLPSFAAEAGNKKIVFTWDAVPNTQSYTLYYTSNGSLPSDSVGTKVSDAASPYTLSAENGKMYTFRLKAAAQPGWTDSLSDYVKAIPLSERTLVPRAYGKRGKIVLDWNEIDATDQFTIFRRVGETGTFDEFRTVSGTSFTDSTAQNGQSYYYKVRPAANATVLSGAAGARTDGFDTSPSAEANAALYSSGVKDIFVAGGYLYGSSGSQGMVVFDAKDPADPRKIAYKRPPNNKVYRTVVSDIGGTAYAFAAAGADGLYIYNVAAPDAPVLAGSYSAGIAMARGVAVSGSYALVVDFSFTNTGGNYGWEATYDCALRVLDVSDPANPTLAATFALDSATAYPYGQTSDQQDPIGIAVDGNYAYVAERGAGLRVVNWTDGFAPSNGAGAVAAVLSNAEGGNQGNAHAYAVSLRDGYAYAAMDYYGIMIVDIGAPGAPVRVSNDSYFANGRIRAIEANGAWLFTTSLDLGLQIFRRDDPEAPRRLRNTPLSYPTTLAVNGAVAYLYSAYAYTHAVIDMNLPLGLVDTAFIATSGLCRDVAVEGSYAYVADGAAGLRIFDVSDQAAPVQLSTVSKAGAEAIDVKVFGEIAFVRYYKDYYSLSMYDVSDPANPAFLSEQWIPYCRGYAASGDYLYTTDYHWGLQIYDIGNPAAPALAKTIDSSAQINDIAISRGYAIVADSTLGALVYDIREPLNAYIVSSVQIKDCEDLCADDTGLIASSFFYDANVCDISDPEEPTQVLEFGIAPRLGLGVALSGNYAFANSYVNGGTPDMSITIVDVSRIGKPWLVADLRTATKSGDIYSNGIAVSGGYLYQATGDGLRIYSMRP